MSWLSWILAYFFGCVHPHTTWPRRHRAGFVYVACLDCGRELPYSLDQMSVVTREQLLADREQVRMARNLALRDVHAERGISGTVLNFDL
jgi:hypothetical protein